MTSHARAIYNKLIQHPICHDLQWHDVRSLFEALGEVEDLHNGHVKVSVAGHSMNFVTPPTNHAMTEEEITTIRRMLKHIQPKTRPEQLNRILVLLSHNEAKIYQPDRSDSTHELIKAHDPLGHQAHVHNKHEFRDRFEEPNYSEFFEQVTNKVKDADEILIFGEGSGSSCTMEQYVNWLNTHHSSLTDRIVDTVKVNESHMTEGQLLAKAREIYA